LAKIGAACSSNGDCESHRCLTGSNNNGYCLGRCPRGGTCPGDAVCDDDLSENDATAQCLDGCSSAAECTRGSPYTCQSTPGDAAGSVCFCRLKGEDCGSDADCCRGNCLNLIFVRQCFQ
jgi:hypothetical protein